MERCDKLNKQFHKAIEDLDLKGVSTVRVTVPQLYHLDCDIVTVDNIWNVLLLQFTLSNVNLYTDSVLLNKEEVCGLKPSTYSGMQVIDALAQLVLDKMKTK